MKTKKNTSLNPFPYKVQITSLKDVAPADAKVCVMNILGNESRRVTPKTHEFSKGNVVAGVQYGRPGKVETALGDIPVYSRVAEVVRHHKFDTGVVYLPPAAVFYAVTELCHYNKNLKKIVIVTEKISVKDQRLIRAVCQASNIDVFGANTLGIGDSWNQVRIGGALGGDHPEETLIKGSVAIHSNSGNFTNTIAEYLKTEGFGTTTLVSSGKDVIIQFAVAEFLWAAQNDDRTKAVVLYVEPGGYYEKQALGWIKDGTIKFDKPIIACVTGRWKSSLTRAVGHAGALAGDNDDAISKETWFDDYFGAEAFDPDRPVVTKKGVRVTSIQHIPQAMKYVFKAIGGKPDFKPSGNLELKPWFGNDFGLQLPLELKIPVVDAISPYREEIEALKKQVGAMPVRQNMRNKSSVSRINEKTNIAELHGRPIVDLIEHSYEELIVYTLLKKVPRECDVPLVNFILNYLSVPQEADYRLLEQVRKNKATPNAEFAALTSILGDHPDFELAAQYMKFFIDFIVETGLRGYDDPVNVKMFEKKMKVFKGKSRTNNEQFVTTFLDIIKNSPNPGNILNTLAKVIEKAEMERPDIFIITAVLFHLALPELILKKITKQNVIDLYTYFAVIARLTSAANMKGINLSFIGKLKKFEGLQGSFSRSAFIYTFGYEPDDKELLEFNTLLALTLTNGAGTLSAKGAKESVSARNHISMTYTGFLSNTGLAHGGSGFEAVEYLMESFEKYSKRADIQKLDGVKIKKLAVDAAVRYKAYKDEQKAKGARNYKRIPCINHPVFKGKPINIDPREDFIYRKFKTDGIGNVFWDFYHDLVTALHDEGVTPNVYCVNIDAVIAVISLKLMWKSIVKGDMPEDQMQRIGFIIFLLGRMVGVSAEIIDHRDRGQDMDCRTPVGELEFVI